ncbi:MAG: clan AA aspartic protease [Treponema sp.]|jgi:clan AA aspartic protease|nr:clan AA aspartic protease [Treponema sp.]
MGTVYTEITLKNAIDVGEFQRGHISEQEVRTTTVQALVDTGAGSLIISEPVREKLGLAVKGLRSAALANGGRETCRLTEPVEIRWKDRYTTCHALVLPGVEEVLLGAIPLEDMDLLVDPARRELTGAHGDEVVCMVK